jgi:hypothetical protein
MHISLDSALGRQRRLNSVGESVLQIAPNAAAAYSLRSLTGGDPKVVRVRRSSDNTESDFTASGVSSGALTSFVNEIQTLGTVTNSVGNDGFTLTNKSSTGFTATTDTATGVCGWPYTAKAGDKITVSFDAVIRSGTPQFLPRRATALSSNNLASVVSDSPLSVNSTASYSFEFTYDDDQAGSLTFSEGDDNADFDISNFQVTSFKGAGLVETWYDQSGNNRPLIQTTASEQPLIVEAGTFLNGVKSNQATSNDTMQNLQVSTDGTNADFGTDDWASGASSKLGAVYVGTVPSDSVVTPASTAIIWGGGRGVGSFQLGGVSLTVVKGGTDSWSIRNERQGLSPSTMTNATSLNTDADVVLYGTTDNREFTINVNGSGDTETESADLDVREGQALSLFGAYNGSDGSYYQRSSGGVCKECYLYAGDPVANIPALATSINSHYSIY